MSDLASELAALIADTLALTEAIRATGGQVVPRGPLEGLPPAAPGLPEPARASARPPEPPRAEPRAFQAPPARPAVRAPEPPRTAPAPRPEPPRAEAPRASSPLPGTPPEDGGRERARVEPPAGGGFAGLFGGRWEKVLRDPAEELAKHVGGAPACERCGTPGAGVLGVGDVRARLVVVAAGPRGERLVGDAGVMFDRMLVHVLAMERADAFVIEAPPCAVEAPGPCRDRVLKQVEAVGPRVILAMGRGVSAFGADAERGEWSRHAGADLLPTFHPAELLVRPADKRAAMDHLTAVRNRL